MLKVEENGWNIDLVDTSSDAWWVLEAWELTSVWSPVGKNIFLVLGCDPLSEDEDSIDEKFYSILVSNQMPDFMSAKFEFYIKAKWERGFKEFCQALPEFRTEL